MGSQSDNGGNLPGDGSSPDGLPDLPEEWGVIVVPDDLTELSDEVEAVQAELRRDARHTRWQQLTDRRGLRLLRRLGTAALRAPILIISLAILVTMASLFASAWPSPTRNPATQRTAATADDATNTLPPLELLNADGQVVTLHSQLPAVILLTDGCDCDKLITDTISAVPSDVYVITVTAGPATAEATLAPPPTSNTPQAQGKKVRALRDPADQLRRGLDLGKPDNDTATAVLVDDDGEIVRLVARVVSLSEFEPDLARL